MMRHKRSQVDHERFIKILEKEKAELEESLTEMEARLILVLKSLRKLERTTWAHSTLLLHKKMTQMSHLNSPLVPETGLEPARREAYAPKAYVYTNFTTRAC